MTEIPVEQRTAAWHELRRCVCVTASCFSEAVGVGRGKPYHFLQSLLEPPCDDDDSSSVYTQHGLRLEPDINDAYQLLTGLETKVSGFWIADDSSGLAGIVGASPDAKVYEHGRLVGLAEFKAPVYSLNCDGCRIPRAHMAQVQGQLAICRAPWCDYMAVCTLTQQVALLRVHFAPVYWSSISASLRNFCDILQTTQERIERGLDALDFTEANELKHCGMKEDLFDGEDEIVVKDLLSTDVSAGHKKYYRSLSGTWMSYEFLVGKDPCCVE